MESDATGRLVQATFRTELNVDFYNDLYPDVQNAGMTAEDHYQHHGKKEGRLPAPYSCDIPDDLVFNRKLPTVLLTSNDLSRTGAPVLVLQLMRSLADRYNIVLISFHRGDLEAHFLKLARLVVVLNNYVDRPALVSSLVDSLVQRFQPEKAILNTVLSWVFEAALTKARVPFIHLVHEYADYSGITAEVFDSLERSRAVVFSSRIVMDGYSAMMTERGANFVVVPQGKSEIPGSTKNEEFDEPLAEIRRLKAEGKKIYLGAGHVQIRKGVDLFLMVADRFTRKRKSSDSVFVWVGKGFDPIADLGYSAYIESQRKQLSSPGNVRFLGDSHRLQDIYSISDAFLLTSRLDPLPNVAIDAILEGVPVYCFKGATGLVEILEKESMATSLVVPYLDVDAMAAALARNTKRKRFLAKLRHRLVALGKREFDFESYRDKLLALF